MRAAAVAFVLIVGAAVVLWFGNTVNSWVLGGLMGGLAAILLAIPISLTLFSFFSRRHDRRYGTIEPEMEARSLAQSYEYEYAYEDEEEEENQPVFVEVMEEDEYELPARRERYEDRNSRHMPMSRKLPTPNYLGLPAPGQSSASANSAMYRHDSMQLPASKQQTKSSPEQRTYNPGKSVYQGRVTRSLHHSEALRIARQEAMQRQEDEEDFRTTAYDLRRDPTDRPVGGRPSRQLPRQRGYQNQKRRLDVDSTQPQVPGTRRYPRTEPINRGRGYPQTGSFRQEKQTGRMNRDVQWDEEYFDPEVSTGTLKKPLVRRAPYMYEDDPLRQELSQQIDRPIRRRSSRYEDEE
jgi:hypothetical protein